MKGASSNVPRAAELGLIGCHLCGEISSAPAADAVVDRACPRCGAALHRRKAASLSRTWALLIAALVLYLPANLLPVLYTSLVGAGEASTIIGGIVDFWRSGNYDIAAIIFVASVAVPTTKFAVLALLLVTVQRRSDWAPRQRARLYRLVEAIGYWSMLDVVVVALVAALVQFQALGTAEPRQGIVYFGLTVVLTMLAAMSFDPRLIWDAREDAAPLDASTRGTIDSVPGAAIESAGSPHVSPTGAHGGRYVVE